MQNLFFLALCFSFAQTAIHVSMWEGMIFEKLKTFLNKYINEFWAKPLYGCLVCMGGIWSLVFLGLMLLFSAEVPLLMVLPLILITIGINTVISHYINS